MKRYIIHLLPEASQRASLDELRAQVAERIGWNRALDYPTSHVTLVYAIQDEENDPEPIEEARLAGRLDRLAGHGAIQLSLGAPAIHGPHLLRPIKESARLADVRRAAGSAAREIAGGSNSRYAKRAATVKEQSWPHLTLAQEIDPARARQALAFLVDTKCDTPASILATEIALLSRDLSRGDPYVITHRVTL